jgi:hypothetical protein
VVAAHETLTPSRLRLRPHTSRDLIISTPYGDPANQAGDHILRGYTVPWACQKGHSVQQPAHVATESPTYPPHAMRRSTVYHLPQP